MRVTVVVLTIALAACAAPPPRPSTAPAVPMASVLSSPAPAVGQPRSPRARYLARARDEMRQARPDDIGEIARMAAEDIVAETPGAPQRPQRRPRTATERAAATAWEEAVLREQAYVADGLRESITRDREVAYRADRAARQEQYCRDLAGDVSSSTASSGELLAGMVTGELPAYRRIYGNCIGSFRRANDYLD